MRLVLQRVKKASVTIDSQNVGEIGLGILILLGVGANDKEVNFSKVVSKILNLRIFADHEGKMNKSLIDVNGEVLVVSQFTLYANCKSGRRPDFISAAKPEIGKNIYLKMIEEFKLQNINTKNGEFGADMQIELINDGPVTIILDDSDV